MKEGQASQQAQSSSTIPPRLRASSSSISPLQFIRQHKIRERLEDASINRLSGAEKFITHQSLESVWPSELWSQFVASLAVRHDPSLARNLRRDLLKTISILITIRWDDWEKFENIYLEHEKSWGVRKTRGDDSLPHSFEVLEDDSFLGKSWASDFERAQYTYLPIVIEQGAAATYTRGRPLPFVRNKTEPIARGAYSSVNRAVIASHQFKAKSAGTQQVTNSMEIVVAMKVFLNRGDFRREARNLEILNSSFSNHSRIVEYLAMFTIEDDHDDGSPPEFFVLMPLADADLRMFLYSPEYEPRFTGVPDLLREATNLIDAVSWLHAGLRLSDRIFVYYHIALQPDNILVYLNSSSSVGCWKISGLGESYLITKSTSQISAREPSLPVILRAVGLYSAPEIEFGNQVGPACDMWSLGCILSQVLARGEGGIALLNDLDEKRASFENGSTTDHFYQRTNSGTYLHPSVRKWLENRTPVDKFPDSYQLIEGCKQLILRLLLIDPKQRLSAIQLREAMVRLMVGVEEPPIRVEARISVPQPLLPSVSNRPNTPPPELLGNPQNSMPQTSLLASRLSSSRDTTPTSHNIPLARPTTHSRLDPDQEYAASGPNHAPQVNVHPDLDIGVIPFKIAKDVISTVISSTKEMVAFIAPQETTIHTLYAPHMSLSLPSLPAAVWEHGSFAGNFLALRDSYFTREIHIYRVFVVGQRALTLEKLEIPPKARPAFGLFDLFAISQSGMLIVGSTGWILLCKFLDDDPRLVQLCENKEIELHQLWFSSNGRQAFARFSTPSSKSSYVTMWDMTDTGITHTIVHQSSSSDSFKGIKRAVNINQVLEHNYSTLLRERDNILLLQTASLPARKPSTPYKQSHFAKNLQAMVVTPDGNAVILVRSHARVSLKGIRSKSSISALRIEKIGTFRSLSLPSEEIDLDLYIENPDRCAVAILEIASSYSRVRLLIAHTNGNVQIRDIDLPRASSQWLAALLDSTDQAIFSSASVQYPDEFTEVKQSDNSGYGGSKDRETAITSRNQRDLGRNIEQTFSPKISSTADILHEAELPEMEQFKDSGYEGSTDRGASVVSKKLAESGGYPEQTIPPSALHDEMELKSLDEIILFDASEHEQGKVEEDVRSLLSNDDDIQSKISTKPSYQDRLAEETLGHFLARHAELRPLCEEALGRIGKSRFIANFRRLLKEFYIDLRPVASTELEKVTVNLLRSRYSRIRLADQIADTFSHETAEESEDILRGVEDKMPILEDWISQNPLFNPVILSAPKLEENALDQDPEEFDISPDSSSDEEDDEKADGKNPPVLPKIAEMEGFLSTCGNGRPIRKLSTNLRLFLLPPSLSPLSRLLMSIPKAKVWLDDIEDNSLSNQFKGLIEDLTEDDWNWWPLRPRMRALQKDETRLNWICHCKSHIWIEMPKFRAEKLLALVQQAPAVEHQKHLCLKRSVKMPSRSVLSRIANPWIVAAPVSNPPQKFQVPSSTSTSKTTNGGKQPHQSGGSHQAGSPMSSGAASTKLKGQNSQVVSINMTNLAELVVLFGVKGARRTLELAQVDVSEHNDDSIFFQDLRRDYKKHRGFLGYWLSIWQLRYCDFVKFEKIRADRIISNKKDDLPVDILYDYTPRPPKVEIPPIHPHEFELALLPPCSANCLLSPFHDCTEPLSGNLALSRIPKRKQALELKTGAREVAWGIQAHYSVSFILVVFYHVLIFSGTFGFWIWWQVVHPDDIQNASTLLTVVAVFLSLFWSASGVLKMFRDPSG